MTKLIVALDYPDAQQALSMAKQLTTSVEWVKVGLELFTHAGPSIIESLKNLGFNIMLDLKFFDIPNTVKKSIRSAYTIGADIITLHILGGETMVKTAIQELQSIYEKKGHKPLLFGVTVLTSMKQGELPAYSQNLQSLVITLAKNAQLWGLNGIVCSGQDVSMLKPLYPSLLYLTPGIRMPQSTTDDQERIITPEEAILAGSDFLVVGRPITQSKHPIQAAKTFIKIIHDTTTL